MPALNFIVPPAAAGPSQAAPSAAAAGKIPPAEKFQSVMERVAESFSNVPPPANAKSEPTPSADQPARKKKEAGKTRADATDNAPLPAATAGTDPAPDVLSPPLPECGVTAVANELAAAAAPAGSAKKTDQVQPPPPAVVSEPLSGVDAGDENSSVPAQESASAKPRVNLPVALSPVATGTPGTSAARTENQSSRVEPMSGATLSPPPEEPANETLVSVSDGKTPEIQESQVAISVGGGGRLPATPAPASPSSDDGTAVAQQVATMKMAAKTTNFSEAKQKLPGEPTAAAGENLPAAAKSGEDGIFDPQRKPAPATIIIRVESARPADAAISVNTAADEVISPAPTNLIPLPPQTPRFVERTGEMISLRVAHLNEAGANEMRVVIQPDTGLQLSLHLQQRDGGVEVRAVLDRGNFELLNRHWPELQQQLESRGVRVAPLASADPIFGGGSEGFRHPTTSHGQQAGDDADPAGAPAVLLPGLPPATATSSASKTSSHLWESWA